MRSENFYEYIKSNPASFKQISCKDVLIAHYNCPQVELKTEYYSPCNFITYTISGEKKVHKSGNTFHLVPDSAIFAKKGAYLFEKFENVEHCIMVFFIPDSYLQQFVRENRTQLPPVDRTLANSQSVVELDLNARTKAFFQSMLPYFLESHTESLLELKFKELLLNLLTNPNNKSLLSIVNSIQQDQRPVLSEVMEENFRYNLGMEDFAKIALRSLPTFKREFKEIFHTTPGKWLLERRLKNAYMLLQNTTMPVTEVALESGFENHTHFSRVFKDHFGKSPLHSRKAYYPAEIPM